MSKDPLFLIPLSKLSEVVDLQWCIENSIDLQITKKSKKNTKVVKDNNIELFKNILRDERTILKHKRITNISASSKQYAVLKNIVGVADNFCKEFSLSQLDGYRVFIQIGLEKMGKLYGINKFEFYADYIFTNYEVKQSVNSYEDKVLFKKVLTTYAAEVLRDSSSKWTDKELLNILDTCKMITKYKANPSDWVNAQIQGLEEVDVVYTETYHLCTDAAYKRYLKYMKSKTPTKQLTPFEKAQRR